MGFSRAIENQQRELGSASQAWFLNLALEDDQLLTQQGILCNQLASAEPKIGSRAQEERSGGTRGGVVKTFSRKLLMTGD